MPIKSVFRKQREVAKDKGRHMENDVTPKVRLLLRNRF